VALIEIRSVGDWISTHDSSSARSAEGMIVALLADSGPGHIVVGGRTLWLRDGETCAYTVGTPIRVLYAVVDGRRLVDGIMAMPPLG
jgi:hypothetical protein